jgi:hypothetical protein
MLTKVHVRACSVMCLLPKTFEYGVGFVIFRNRKFLCIEAGDNKAIIDICECLLNQRIFPALFLPKPRVAQRYLPRKLRR